MKRFAEGSEAIKMKELMTLMTGRKWIKTEIILIVSLISLKMPGHSCQVWLMNHKIIQDDQGWNWIDTP